MGVEREAMATIESIYQDRRDTQARQLDMRTKRIYKDYPDLEKISNRLSLKQLELLKAKLLAGDNFSDTDLELDLMELQRQRDSYMKDYSINPEDLKLQYYCNLCQDRGFIVTDQAHTKCTCMLKIMEDLRGGQSHISKRMDQENFKNFDLTIFDNVQRYDVFFGERQLTEQENILEIKNQAHSFIENFSQRGVKSMLYHGAPGLGKSYMCYSIAKELIDRGIRVLYLTMNEFMDLMQLYSFDREMFMQRYTMEDYYAVEKADLLILDDLGTEVTNSFVKTVLFNTINSRMINGSKMIISTNLSPDEILNRYDERISSRIMDYMQIYKFFGDNKRLG